MLGNMRCQIHNINMTPNEQILGVLQVINSVRAVTAVGSPILIERDRFSAHQDYESILEKLEWDYDAISINQYPKIDGVTYHTSVGFADESKLKNDYSYRLTIKPLFSEVLKKYQSISSATNSYTILTLDGTNIVAIFPDGKKRIIKKLRTDLGTFNFMRYIFIHQNKDIPISVIQTEVKGCKSREDLTELVRNCGFDKVLKSYFFEGTTKRKVRFTSQASVPSDIVTQLQN